MYSTLQNKSNTLFALKMEDFKIYNHQGGWPPFGVPLLGICLRCGDIPRECNCNVFFPSVYRAFHKRHRLYELHISQFQIFPRFEPCELINFKLPPKESTLKSEEKQDEYLKVWNVCCENSECKCQNPYVVYTHHDIVIQLDFKGNKIYPFEGSVFETIPKLHPESKKLNDAKERETYAFTVAFTSSSNLRRFGI